MVSKKFPQEHIALSFEKICPCFYRIWKRKILRRKSEQRMLLAFSMGGVLALGAALFSCRDRRLDCPIKSKKAAEEGVFVCGLQASDIACIKKSTCPAPQSAEGGIRSRANLRKRCNASLMSWLCQRHTRSGCALTPTGCHSLRPRSNPLKCQKEKCSHTMKV